MKPLGFAILSFSLLILACQDMRKSDEKGTIVFSQSSSNEWLSKLDCQFIPLETNDSCLVSTVSDMVFDSSRLYLIDGKSNLVFAFSLSGEFIS